MLTENFSNPQDMSEIVSIIIQPARLPVYIHCLDGSEATGLVICCLRRLQAWDSECAINEFCRYSRSGEMLPTEHKFVRSFKAPSGPRTKSCGQGERAAEVSEVCRRKSKFLRANPRRGCGKESCPRSGTHL